MKDIIEKHLLESRIVKVYGEITENCTSQIIDQLMYLDLLSDDNIIMYINSGGGSAEGAFAICDTISTLRSKVATIGISRAHSAAALLICAGHKGMRYAYPNSHIMIHKGSTRISYDYIDEVEQKMKFYKNCEKKYDDLFRKFSGISEKKYKQLVNPASFMIPDEAIKLGIIDKIITKETRIRFNKTESYTRPF